MIIKLYNILLWMMYPIVRMYVAYRSKIGKEDRTRLHERFGKYKIARPEGVVYWIHAASVGESLSAITFINRMKSITSKKCTFLLTTGTVTSANNIEKHISDGIIHQFIPIDYSIYVDRFFKHWKPDYGFIIESELWPNLITRNTTKSLFLLNARLSQRSFRRWMYCGYFIKTLLSRFRLILTQTEQDTKRFQTFVDENNVVLYTGNLKYSSPPLAIDSVLLDLLKGVVKKYVFVAASTHSGEEEVIIDAYSQIIRSIGNDVTLIIVPRHPIRAQSIVDLIHSKGYTSVLRTQLTDKCVGIDTVCVDTFGELGTVFSIADFVFIGGSLVKNGGHNIFEPIQLGKPVMFGPHMFNFEEMKHMSVNCGIGFQVNCARDISDVFCRFIKNGEMQTNVLRSITDFQKFDPVEDIILKIQEIIDR